MRSAIDKAFTINARTEGVEHVVNWERVAECAHRLRFADAWQAVGMAYEASQQRARFFDGAYFDDSDAEAARDDLALRYASEAK